MALCGFLLAACVPAGQPTIPESLTATPRDTDTATQAPTHTITATQTTTLSPSAALIPSPTITPTDVPTLSTNRLPDSVENEFFFGGNSPECQLPCWNGLIIGESGQENIQAVFDEVLGVNGMVDLFAEPPASYVPDAYAPEGFDIVGYRWSNRVSLDYLEILLYVEEESHILRGMSFDWGTSGLFDPHISLGTILRELGPPSQLLMDLSMTEAAYYEGFDITVVYEEEGIAFFLYAGLDVDVETGLADYCLEDEFDTRAFITEPVQSGFRDMTPPQESMLGFISGNDRLEPSEGVIGLTAEELTALAMQEEDPCATITVRRPEAARPAVTETLDVSALSTSMLPDSVENEFFLGGNDPECQLPCWNGLIIGESGQEDIQAVFDDALGLNGMVDLFAEPPAHFPSAYATEGFDVAGYQWSDSNRLSYLQAYLFVEEDTHVLQGMLFHWGGESRQFDPPKSLRPILRELGPPSQLLVDLSPMEWSSYVYRFSIAAIYQEEGISFILFGSLPVDTEIWQADYCLGDNFSLEEVYITEPLQNGLRDLSPLQEDLLNAVNDWYRFDSSEEVLGLTAEEVTALAMQDEDVCLTIQLEP